MKTNNTPPNLKDGRTLKGKGHRLGWISEAMHQRVADYATRYGYKTVNDAVVALIDLSLTEDEEGIDYKPPAITTLFEVEQD